MENKLFSLYYINIEKVYELRMIRNNVILENRVLENKTESESHDSISAGLTAGIKGIINSEIGGKASFESLKSVKVSDTFTVKQTKSNILSDIVNMARKTTNIDNISNGELIMIDNLKLKLENEQLVRLFKILSRDIIKGQVANGIDVNKALNALAKDYAYLLSTTINGKHIVMKVPMTGEGEFENKYSIDDLLIGDVSVIGVYKGNVNGSEINSTFDFFMNIGNAMDLNNSNDEEIQSSSIEKSPEQYSLATTLKDGEEYIFIDLLAIVQNIKVQEASCPKIDDKRECLIKRLFKVHKK